MRDLFNFKTPSPNVDLNTRSVTKETDEGGAKRKVRTRPVKSILHNQLERI
jgi:hypothetical protein